MKSKHVLTNLITILFIDILLLCGVFVYQHTPKKLISHQKLPIETVPVSAEAETLEQPTSLREHFMTTHTSETGSIDLIHEAPLIEVQEKHEEHIDIIPPDNYIFTFASNNNIPRLTQLLEHGVSANLQDENQVTPLMFSVAHQQMEATQLLLEHKADPNLQDIEGYTALMWASIQGNLPLLNLLLQANADPNLTTTRGITALHWAAKNCFPEICSALVAGGADLSLKTNFGATVLDASKQFNCPAVTTLLHQLSKEHSS